MRADTINNLRSLKGLLDSGAITREEFEREKALLLSEVVPPPLPSRAGSRGGVGRNTVLWAGVAFLLMACAIAAYLVHWPSGSSDVQIVNSVKEKLAADPDLSQYRLQVSCTKGVVVLTGSVKSEDEKSKATALAAQVAGVKEVNIFGIVVNMATEIVNPDVGGNSQSQGKNIGPPAILPPTSDISSVDFRNFSYESGCQEHVDRKFPKVIPVRNGKWDSAASESEGSLIFNVVKTSYGDIKGDGSHEAIVITACSQVTFSASASFDYEELFIFEALGGSPRLLSVLTPDDDIPSHGPNYDIVKAGQGELDVSYQAAGNGAACCPEWTVTDRLRWNGSRFASAGQSRKKNSADLGDTGQDAQTASAVQARINADPVLRKYHLLTTCGGGVVTLTGSVNSIAEKRKAAAVAHVKNVVSVNTSGIVVNGAVDRDSDVLPPGNPPTISLQANPTSITPGQQVTLTWQSTNATAVSLNGMPEPPTGQQVFTPTQPITYQAVATSSSGQTASAVAVIIVKRPVAATLSAGTPIRVRMSKSLDSGKESSGNTFQATLDQNLMAGGHIVASAGTEVDGRVVVAKKAGILGGTSELALELSQILVNGQSQPITTNRFDSSAPGGNSGGAQLVAGELAVNDAIYTAGTGGITNVENTANQVIKAFSKKSVVVSSGAVLQFSLQQPVTITLPPQ